MRLRNKPGAREKVDSNPGIAILNPKEMPGKWSEEFGNNNPIHLEIGTGRGDFIIGMAQKYPNVNFIGMEKYTSVIVDVLDKLLELDLPNVRLLNFDAENLEAYFAPEEVDRVYINFSDPWPKVRHHKRRLSHESFLNRYKKIMKSDGEIHQKTDNMDLFEFSLESYSNNGFALKNVSVDLHRLNWEDNVMTEYEAKFSAKGQKIYRVEAFQK